MKGTIGDAFVCKICERSGNEEGSNIQENMDLENAMCLDRFGKFCYLRIC